MIVVEDVSPLFPLVPGIMDVPGSVMTDLCAILDSTAQHNWRRLVEHVPDYTHKDVMELLNLAQQVAS